MFSQRVTIELPDGKAKDAPEGVFTADWRNIAMHYQMPQWFKDAKFGIFIHWGVYSVPASGSEWYPKHMYNGLLEQHTAKWGSPDKFGYKDFIPMFKAENFDPDQWIDLFIEAGAKYVIPTAEHHDGFALYDSDLTRWDAVDQGPHRDLIGDLAAAARRRGMKFGVSNHRIENWDFMWPEKAKETDLFDPEYADLYGPPQQPGDNSGMGPKSDDGKEIHPQSDEFLEEWLARAQEIVDKYHPDLYYFDNGVNYRSLDPWKKRFAAYYYNTMQQYGQPEVSIQSKSDAFIAGTIRDYERMSRAPKEITEYYWQVDEPIGNKFGYIENLQVQNAQSVVRSLVNNISRNGNLCLNISPKADGTIPDNQQKVLREVGAWLKTNGEGVYSTQAWTTDAEGALRFTTNNDCVYVFALDAIDNGLMIKSLASGSGYKVKEVYALASGAMLDFEQTDEGLKVQNATTSNANGMPTVFKVVLSPIRVLFIGDSITDGSWGCSKGSAVASDQRNHWDKNHIFGHGYMEQAASALMAAAPGRYECFNRGISGNTLSDLEARWEADCINIDADIVSVLIGTNDAAQHLQSGTSEAFCAEAWAARLDALIQSAKDSNPNAVFVLCTPFVAKVGKVGDSPQYAQRQEIVEQLSRQIEKIATKRNAVLVPFGEMVTNLVESGPSASYWIWDGIHPTPPCHKMLANLWLEKTKSSVAR